MKSLNSKIALGVLSMAMLGFGANNASASLLHHLVNGVGNTVGGVVGGVGEVVGGLDDVVDEVVDEVVNVDGYTVNQILDHMHDNVGAELGLAALILENATIDLHGLDITSWTEADAQVLADLKLLGIDIDALIDAAALVDASIITDQGIDVDALVCVLANGSLDVGVFGTNVISADLIVNIGAALGFDIDPSGLDLGLALGECDTCDVVGPVDPNNPGGTPTSPVPEPATAALGLMGLGAMAMAARRRRGK